jgi:hypothetical protein
MAAILFSLHEVEDVTEEERMTTTTLHVLEVFAQQLAVAVRVIEVNV